MAIHYDFPYLIMDHLFLTQHPADRLVPHLFVTVIFPITEFGQSAGENPTRTVDCHTTHRAFVR